MHDFCTTKQRENIFVCIFRAFLIIEHFMCCKLNFTCNAKEIRFCDFCFWLRHRN